MLKNYKTKFAINLLNKQNLEYLNYIDKIGKLDHLSVLIDLLKSVNYNKFEVNQGELYKLIELDDIIKENKLNEVIGLNEFFPELSVQQLLHLIELIIKNRIKQLSTFS